MTLARVATTSPSGTSSLSLAFVGDFFTAAAVATQTGSTQPKSAGTDAVIRRTVHPR